MNKKQRYIFLGGLIFITGIAFCMVVNIFRANMTKYEYYKDGQFGISKECYITQKGHCMCKINNNFVVVDSYYEV